MIPDYRPDPDELAVLGIDPGVTTGWALIAVPFWSIYGDDPGEILFHETGELNGWEVDQIREIAYMARPLNMLIKEREGTAAYGPAIQAEGFDLHTKVKSADVLAPVRIEAALRFAVSTGRAGDATRMPPAQMPALAKSSATDERLKAWGLYTEGSDHERDATRQAITLIRRAKSDEALRKAAWGER